MKYLNSKERQLPWYPNQVIVTYDGHKMAPFYVYAGELPHVLDIALVTHKQGVEVNGKRITADRITAIEVRLFKSNYPCSWGFLVHSQPEPV